jgi:putative holliday junction resolvase
VNRIESKRILGIDFGSTRIGLALSDPSGTIATGFKTINNTTTVYDEIAGIVTDHEIAVIVIGLPVSLQGGDTKKTEEVRRFSSELRKRIPVPIVFQDERFTSRDAMATMIAMNTTRKQRRNKGRIDEMAAAIILQAFLDTERARQKKDNHGRTL